MVVIMTCRSDRDHRPQGADVKQRAERGRGRSVKFTPERFIPEANHVFLVSQQLFQAVEYDLPVLRGMVSVFLGGVVILDNTQPGSAVFGG